MVYSSIKRRSMYVDPYRGYPCKMTSDVFMTPYNCSAGNILIRTTSMASIFFMDKNHAISTSWIVYPNKLNKARIVSIPSTESDVSFLFDFSCDSNTISSNSSRVFVLTCMIVGEVTIGVFDLFVKLNASAKNALYTFV
jgi:hypothetical protein